MGTEKIDLQIKNLYSLIRTVSIVIKSIQNQIRPYLSTTALKSVGQVMGSQLLLQIMGFGIGIILVREMSKDDYAIYTILMAVQGMLAILSTSGIMVGFTKIGGEIWSDINKMASLIKTSTYLRSYITAAAFLIAGSYGGYLLVEQNIPNAKIIFFLICILFIIIPEIYKSFIIEALLLRKEFVTVQKVQILTQGLRLLALLAIFLIYRDYLTIFAILLVTIFGVWVGYWYLLKKSKHLISKSAQVVDSYRKTLLHYVKRMWHIELFYAFRGQISIFLVGVFGATSSLANLGALTRFSVIFTVLIALVTNLIAPRFARTQHRERLKTQYFQLVFILTGLSLLMISFAYLFPELFLWVLGPKYTNLKHELVLVIILGAINLVMAGIGYLNQTKGWIKLRTYFEIPMIVLLLVIGVNVFDISSLIGVLSMAVCIELANLLLAFSNSFLGFSSMKH